jgi:hypothetical protein
MRYLLCSALALAACERAKTPGADRVDTAAMPSAAETTPAPAMDTAAFAALLEGTWTAQGLDSGSTRPQPFTITWTRAPGGGLAGKIAFKEGEAYAVKVVSMSDSMFMYESEPHRSPTLKAEVVTQTQARLVGDSLLGTYEARATAGEKTLRGRFTATRRAPTR